MTTRKSAARRARRASSRGDLRAHLSRAPAHGKRSPQKLVSKSSPRGHLRAPTDEARLRIRFDHFEEFRGRLAEKMDEEMRGFTRRAFQAMNEALAGRVRALAT